MCWACSLYHVDMNRTHVENIFVLHMFKYSPWLCSMMHYAHRENVYVLEVCSHIEWHEHVFYIHRCCIMREHFCSWSVACVFCKCPDTDAASRGSQALIFGEHVVLYVCSWCGPRYEMMGAGILVYPIMHIERTFCSATLTSCVLHVSTQWEGAHLYPVAKVKNMVLRTYCVLKEI